MNIVNVRDLKPYVMSAHGGEGNIKIKFSFEDQKGIGMWNFFAIAELPVGATVGYHTHLGNDEWYYIIEGKAIMIVDGESKEIGSGDCILTKSGSSHGISTVDAKLMFIAVEVRRKDG